MGLNGTEIFLVFMVVFLIFGVGKIGKIGEWIGRMKHGVPSGDAPLTVGGAGEPEPVEKSPDAATIVGPTEDAELVDD